MLRKIWKILWISVLSFIAFVIIVATLSHIFIPEEALKEEPISTEPAERTESTPEPPLRPPQTEYKTVDWTRTPEEQGLKVGDWIVARGQPGTFIGALKILKRQQWELKYHEKADLRIGPTASPLPPNIKIDGVVVFDIPNPAQHPIIVPYNQLRFQNQARDLTIIGQITHFSQPLKKSSIRIWIDTKGHTLQFSSPG